MGLTMTVPAAQLGPTNGYGHELKPGRAAWSLQRACHCAEERACQLTCMLPSMQQAVTVCMSASVQAKGRLPDQIATVATVIGGLVGVGVLGYLGLTLSAVN